MIIHLASNEARMSDCGQKYVMNVHELVTYPEHVNCEECILHTFQVMCPYVKQLRASPTEQNLNRAKAILSHLSVLSRNMTTISNNDPHVEKLMNATIVVINSLMDDCTF